MKKILLNELKVYKDFLLVPNEKFQIVFSTAENGRSFNRHTEEGKEELKSLLKDFEIESVQYLQQVHSDKVFVLNSELDFIENEGDAIVSNKHNIAAGVFTADCVPIILIDEENLAFATVHSGWKGTYNSIIKKTVKSMQEEYGTNPISLKAYIGPHIKRCCYEVSEDLKEKFIEKTGIDENELFIGNNLSLERCVENDLLNIGLREKNIYSLGLCTHCNEEVKLHSYRRAQGTYGRLFSFAIVK